MKKNGKKLLSLLLALCVTAGGILPGAGTAQVAASEVNIEDGLKGYWTFDGNTDTEILKNNAKDSQLTATKEGEGVALKSDGGVSGGSAYFSKQASSCIRVKNMLDVSTTDFTFTAWLKFDKDVFGAENVTVFQQTNPGRGILLLFAGAKFGSYLSGQASEQTDAVDLGKWVHVAMTSNHQTRETKFYVNGQLVKSTTQGTSAYAAGKTDVLFGIQKDMGAGSALKGSMDEVRFYEKIVDEDTINAIYKEYGDGLELKEAKEELKAQITEAQGLKNGTQESFQALQAAITSAQSVLSSQSSTAEAINEAINALDAAMSAYRNSAPVEIVVDTTEELREIPDAMYGINHRYHNNAYGSWNAVESKVEEEFDEYTKKAGFGSIRYPGGSVANCFEWKRTIGEDRKKTVPGNVFYKAQSEPLVDPNFGVDEAMTWIYDELHAEAIWVYGMGQGSAADAADLIEYLNAPNDGSNPGGGTDWAAVRAENGHEEPYGVTRFEIGNEYGDTGQTYWMDGRGSQNPVEVYIKGGDMIFNAGTQIYMGHKGNAVAKEEDWSPSASYGDGTANQKRYIRYVPVVKDSVTVSVGGTEWEIVESLEGAGKQNVCTLDYETGELAFGDGENGNIPQTGQEITADYTTHQDGFAQYYDAMKAVADEIGIDIQIYSGLNNKDGFINKMHELGYDDKYDGVIIHKYVGNPTTEQDSQYYEKILAQSKQGSSTDVKNMIDKVKKVSGKNDKLVAVSEFGINYASNDKLETITPAIYIANLLIDYTKMGVEYTNKHCLVDFIKTGTGGDSLGAAMQCVIQAREQEDGSYRFVSTPAARMFSIFGNMTGNTLVSETVANNDTYYNDSIPTVMVLSTKDDYGNTYVTLINNKKEEARDVNISVKGRDLSGTEAEVWYLTSDSVNDKNTLENPDNVDVSKDNIKCNATSLKYTLEPHSVTSIRIPGGTPKSAEIKTVAERGGAVSKDVETTVGSEVMVTATPDEGFEFAGWYRVKDKYKSLLEKVSDETEYTFTVEKSISLTAKFTTQVTVTAQAGGAASGGKKASAGESVTVTATPDEGFEFAGWYVGDKKVSDDAEYTFEVEGRTDLTAKFIKKADPGTNPGTNPGSQNSGQQQTIPGGVTANGVKGSASSKGAELTWPKVTGADGYTIERRTSPNGAWEVVGDSAGASYTDSALKAGSTYYYRIRAYKTVAGQKVYFANAAEQTVQAKMPAKPAKFKAKKTKKGIKLTWKKSDGADGYIIYRSYKKKKGFKKIATIKKGTQTSYLYKKAKKGKTAYYRIKAYVNVGGKKKATAYSKQVKVKR